MGKEDDSAQDHNKISLENRTFLFRTELFSLEQNFSL